MRLSTYFLPTLKENPTDANMVSHRLMVRAGLIRPLSAGIYSWLPFGWRVMKKVMEIIREEMDAIGGQEFQLPALNPIEIWEQTGRVESFGDTLFHLKNRALVLAPTHEEIFTTIAKDHIKSYRDLPQIWYQIQTKFRNEPRPRSGVIRGRQFFMKDSYTFDRSFEELDKGYEKHREAYKRIYSRSGLKFFIVGASSGAMGGTGSQEFMVESADGEDTCALCDSCGYAANLEVASSAIAPLGRVDGSGKPEEIHTPNIKTIDQLGNFLKIPTERLAKSLVYKVDDSPVLVLMSGNDQLNESKLTAALGKTASAMEPEELAKYTGANAGSIGPIGLSERIPSGKKFRIIADRRLEDANELISGANKDDYHITHIDFKRDVKIDGYYDLRTIEAGEPCPNCKNKLRIVNAIEIGHIFKLGTKYSVALHANYLDEAGVEKPIVMGSYGIGVERIIACHIEQNHDANGIIWDKAISPFKVHLISVNMDNKEVVDTAEKLFGEFSKYGVEVLYDDRQGVSPGFKFKDADLLGMPVQVIVGERSLKQGKVELKLRKTGERKVVGVAEVINEVNSILTS
jgi:prolyl-tRNA synthetase